jgi:UPF0755 protein
MSNKKMKLLPGRKPLIFAVGLALFFAWLFWTFGIVSNLSQTQPFTIRAGASVSNVARELQERGFIDSVDGFKIMVIGFGGEIQAGGYDLPAGASTWRIAKMLATGDIASTTIVVPEGLTTIQIVSLLNENSFLVGDTCRGMCPADGELFPDTYRVAKGTNRAAVIKLMQDKMLEIQRAWEASGKHAPAPLKSWNEVITLASIVQKETPQVDEMPTVASVYLNRLRIRMRLQADPTIVYALTQQLGDMQGAPLLSEHLQIDSPFNTYRNYGLPPSPIANPGREAITAVLNPADTKYLFFVADGRGGHNFSEDFEGHKANRVIWREAKKNK